MRATLQRFARTSVKSLGANCLILTQAEVMTHDKPTLQTDAELLDILDELKAREPIFHHPELGTDRATLEAMTDPDFWEVGASGRRYSREYCIDTVVKRYEGDYEDDWETRDFHLRQLASDCYLLTYTLIENELRVTRRSTIWRRTEDRWTIVYHQGTIVEDA